MQLAENAELLDIRLSVLYVAKRKRAEARPQGHEADQHAEVSDAVDDERFVRRRAGTVPLEIKADQKVRANPHEFPEHEHHRQIAGDADAEHRKREQREILEEAMVSAAAVKMLTALERDFVVSDVV